MSMNGAFKTGTRHGVKWARRWLIERAEREPHLGKRITLLEAADAILPDARSTIPWWLADDRKTRIDAPVRPPMNGNDT